MGLQAVYTPLGYVIPTFCPLDSRSSSCVLLIGTCYMPTYTRVNGLLNAAMWVLVATVSSFQERTSKQRAQCPPWTLQFPRRPKIHHYRGWFPSFLWTFSQANVVHIQGIPLDAPAKTTDGFAFCFWQHHRVLKQHIKSTSWKPSRPIGDPIAFVMAFAQQGSMSTFQFLPHPSQAHVKTRNQFQEQRNRERGSVQKGKQQKLWQETQCGGQALWGFDCLGNFLFFHLLNFLILLPCFVGYANHMPMCFF